MTIDKNGYNEHGVDISSLRNSLRKKNVMLCISEPVDGQGFPQIVVVQSILSDEDGNEYALTFDDTVIPIDLITAAQDPLPISKSLEWTMTEK